MATVRLGVLGAARILHDAVVAPAAQVPEVEVVAVAARDRDRAAAMAEREGIARVLPDYEAVLADPDVDAVYVPTPAALHGVWMRRAIAAGKHVLCEKPFTANAAEAEEVAALADGSGLVVMEAFHSQHHPLWARLRSLLADGAVGQVREAEADFCVDIADRSDIRWQESMGGGALKVISADNGKVIRTFDQIRAAFAVQWSPDGKSIVYTDWRGVRNVWSQPLSGGPPQKLTDFKDEGIFNCALSFDGKQLACRRRKTTSDAIMISNFR